jgi:hypothetical protein
MPAALARAPDREALVPPEGTAVSDDDGDDDDDELDGYDVEDGVSTASERARLRSKHEPGWAPL